jgi:MFS transporter, putative metabolite:H+ symporter
MQPKPFSLFNVAIVVAALGYFVDIYDLLLFGIIRIPSLSEILASPNLSKDALAELVKTQGESVISWQMGGLLIGGILWGVLGDKKGRLSVLFGSILLYSVGNIANGFVQDVTQYKIIRFIAGIGLAGELGAGITLVSELTPKNKRGIATSLVAGIGLSGAVLAYFMKESFNWRTCYFIGGGLGLFLLILRISVAESGMFDKIKNTTNVVKGNFLMLFNTKERFLRYLKSILVGLPTWFVIGVLVSFSKEFAVALNIQNANQVDPGKAIMFAYAGISIGDILIGLLSQKLRSRKKALFIFYGLTIIFITLYFTYLQGGTVNQLYFVCGGLGFATGFWAIFVTIAAEQFGTNMRATAATTVPNMVRGMLTIFILPVFTFLRKQTNQFTAGWQTAIIIMAITLVAAYFIQETFNKDLDYVEQ